MIDDAIEPVTLWDIAFACGFGLAAQGDQAAFDEVLGLLEREFTAGNLRFARDCGELPKPLPDWAFKEPVDLDCLAHWAEHSLTGRRLRARFPGFAALFVDEQPA